MTQTVMPEVHDALEWAITASPAKRRSWRPTWRAGLLAVGAVIVGGSALAATTGWHPVLGDDHRGHPSAAHASVPSAQGAALAVLRRPQTSADQTPMVRAVLRLLVGGEINGVHVNDVRVLRRHAGGITLLVPAERIGRHDKGYASSIQRQVLCVLTTIPWARAMPPSAGPFRGVGQACGGLNQLRTTGITLAVAGANNRFINDTLVPDGVASVVVPLNGKRVLTLPVRNNTYEYRFPGPPEPPPIVSQWLDAHGQPIPH